MAGRIYNSIRPYLGGLALFLGCIGLLAFLVLIPLALFSANFWTGFSPDGPGMPAVERETSISQMLCSDAIVIFVPLFLGSVLLLAYGLYEARMERTSRV